MTCDEMIVLALLSCLAAAILVACGPTLREIRIFWTIVSFRIDMWFLERRRYRLAELMDLSGHTRSPYFPEFKEVTTEMRLVRELYEKRRKELARKEPWGWGS